MRGKWDHRTESPPVRPTSSSSGVHSNMEGSSCLEGRLASRWSELKGQQNCLSYVDGPRQQSWGQPELINSVANTCCNGPTQQRTRIPSTGSIYAFSFRTIRPEGVGARSSPSKRGSGFSARVSMLKEI